MKAQPQTLAELKAYFRRRQKENDQRSHGIDPHEDAELARYQGKASAYGLAAQKVDDLLKVFPNQKVIAAALHRAGTCDYDGGTWEQVELSGYGCQCLELAKKVSKALQV